jgi:hypothetical protein
VAFFVPVFHDVLMFVKFDNRSDRRILSSPASLVDNEGEECLVQKVLSGNLDKTGNGKREMCFFPFSCITLHTAAAGRGSVFRVAPAVVPRLVLLAFERFLYHITYSSSRTRLGDTRVAPAAVMARPEARS